VTTSKPPCPAGRQWDPIEQICASIAPPHEPKREKADLAVQKSGPAECMADGVCLYKIVVTNHGPGIYEAPLTIIDEQPQGWKLLGGFPTPPWKCTDTDTGFKCDGEAGFAPGDSLELLLELKAPGPSSATPRQVENCARIEWPVTDRDQVSGDPNPNNDLACSVTSIIVPHEEEPPEDRGSEIEPSSPEQKAMEPATCPPGKYQAADGHCCRPSEIWNGRRCICPEGEIWTGRFCDMPPVGPKPDEPMKRHCPRGERWDAIEWMCVSIRKPEIPKEADSITCPRGQHWNGRRCVCEEHLRWDRSRRQCVPRDVKPEPGRCPSGMHRKRGRCVCMPGHHRAEGECIRCPRGHSWNGRHCVPPRGPKEVQPELKPCPPGMHRSRGRCACMPGHHQAGNQCIECPRGHSWNGRHCVPPKGPKAQNKTWQKCPPGMHRRGGRGSCVCMPGHNRAGNACIKCPPAHKWVPQRRRCERIVK